MKKMNSEDHIIGAETKSIDALSALNRIGNKRLQTLFIIDGDGMLLGTLTDGDIRRGLLEGKELKEAVAAFMNTKYRSLNVDSLEVSSINEYRDKGIELIPILDNGKLIRLIDAAEFRDDLPVEAVIMAGGKGKRLNPLTLETPKPLLKIGDLPIIEYGIRSLRNSGIKRITISVNYLQEQIISHFNGRHSEDVTFSFVQEDGPLGTAGALGLLPELNCEAILLMNSDLLTTINFRDFYTFFLQQNADMVIAAVPYNVSIPYAVLETEGQLITNLKEKPVYTYYSNAGIYLIKRKIVESIEKGKHLDATDLIENVIASGGKVVIYHLLEYWLDIGRMEDYKKAQEDIKQLSFK